MKINGDEVNEVESFHYLGFHVQKNGGFDDDMKHRINFGWIKWREVPVFL